MAMIPIPMPAEPACFDAKVRRQGLNFLQEKGQDPGKNPPHGSRDFWEDGDYWRFARDDLRKGYNKRCVYSCFILEEEMISPSGKRLDRSIDHFQPKSSNPAYLAYEWSNLRWAWSVIDNECKKNHHIDEEHDPAKLTHDIVELREDVDGEWIVVPISSLIELESKKVHETIQKLGLNNRKVKIRRRQWIEDFLDDQNQYGNNFMEKRQPFIYRELKRLGRL